MRNTILQRLSVGIASGLLVLTASSLSAYESSRGPTELIYWDQEKALPGYSFVRTRVPGITGSNECRNRNR